MTARPILFSGAMVRALLAGRKTQTRRLVKFDMDPDVWAFDPERGEWEAGEVHQGPTASMGFVRCPCGVPGDRLWVRETWRVAAWRENEAKMALDYAASPEVVRTPWLHPGEHFERLWQQSCDDCRKADAEQTRDGEWKWEHGRSPCRWRPSIHMPRWASRITLAVTGVRVERLQDISEADAIAEGIEEHRGVKAAGVSSAWRDYGNVGRWRSDAVESYESLWESINGPGSWAANPWVWCLTFEVLR